MITEDYVSFETAKLLKEKGFDELCYQKYDSDGELSFNHVGYVNSEKPCDDFYALAPTLQMALKWLREVYNFHIWVEPNHDKEGLYNAHVKVGWWSNNWGGVGYNTYEQACEAAIKYCLENLI